MFALMYLNVLQDFTKLLIAIVNNILITFQGY